MPLLQNIKRLFDSKNDRQSEQSSRELAPLVNFTVSSNLSYEQINENGNTKITTDNINQHNISNTNTNKNNKNKNKNNNSPYPHLPSRFTLQEVLGEGAFSVVYKAFDRETNKTVAIKIISKEDLTNKQLMNIKNEIVIMKKLRHQNILGFLDAYELPKHLFLILEYASGGEIFNKIIEYTYFLEQLSRHVFIQLLTAIEYMHVRNIVHRDIKPENLLFEEIEYFPRGNEDFRKNMRMLDDESKKDEGAFIKGKGGGTIGIIKLADFGLAKQLKHENLHKNLRTPCGTVGYTAPEVISCHDRKQEQIAKKNYYLKLVDIWLLGCFLYTILCGFPPFYDDNPNNLTMKILKGEFVFLKPWWDEILVEAKDLISKMLVINPEERITVEEIWKHPWVTVKPVEVEPNPEIFESTANVQFPDHYFAPVRKRSLSIEHIENVIESSTDSVFNDDDDDDDDDDESVSVEQLLHSIIKGHGSENIMIKTPAPVASFKNLTGLASPRAEAIKMVFNNPVIHTKQMPTKRVEFTDEAFKQEFVLLLLDDDESFSKMDGHNKVPSLTFKNVFSGLGETINEDTHEGESPALEIEDDVTSLTRATGKIFIMPSHNDSLESMNLVEFDRETRLLLIILGIGGDFKFTMNMNNLQLIGRRKLQKSASLGLNNLQRLFPVSPMKEEEILVEHMVV